MDALHIIIKKLKAEPRGSLDKIAKSAKIPVFTLRKIVSGETVDPKWSTVCKLFNYYRVKP